MRKLSGKAAELDKALPFRLSRMSTMFVRNLFARGIWHWCLLVGLFYLASLRGSAKLSKRSGQVELITIKPELHEVVCSRHSS